jgi:small subunit ribosomal protein S1/4-hydroxy-3-methylbut-2-en-1-yl diphosphate reductase
MMSSEAVPAQSAPAEAVDPSTETVETKTSQTSDGQATGDAVEQTPPPAPSQANGEPATTAAAGSTAVAPPAPSTTVPEGPLKRRLRLKPTLGAAEAKPVPTVEPQSATPPKPADVSAPQETSSAPPASEDAPVAEGPSGTAVASESAQPAEMAPRASHAEGTARPASAPVEIPTASQPLDPETEAELAAAMASANLDLAGPAVEAAAAELKAASPAELPPEDELEKGTKLVGKIQSIHGDDVFLDIGYRSPGIVQLRQFTSSKKPLVGQLIEVVVEKVDSEEGLIQVNLPRGVRRSAGNWESVAEGQTVDCMVVKSNKGGLEVGVGSLRGFLPASQVDLGFVSNLETFVGQKLRVQITEVNPKKRKLIVSRRAILELERKDLEAELWTKLAVGQTHSGKVKTIKDYGAFVDIGGVDGFLHIGEISHSRIRHPSDVLKEGQDVEVQVLKLEPEKRKISLGMRQLIQDPWMTITSKYPAESTVDGKVTRVADFGAFVELEPGIEGLVHVSEIAYQRVNRVADVLKEGQEVQAKVLEVDPDRKRIGLSLKALLPRPADKSRPAADEKPVEPYQRQRSGPLKGGTSDAVSKPGGLFGNPGDFGK